MKYVTQILLGTTSIAMKRECHDTFIFSIYQPNLRRDAAIQYIIRGGTDWLLHHAQCCRIVVVTRGGYLKNWQIELSAAANQLGDSYLFIVRTVNFFMDILLYELNYD